MNNQNYLFRTYLVNNEEIEISICIDKLVNINSYETQALIEDMFKTELMDRCKKKFKFKGDLQPIYSYNYKILT